MTTLRRRFGGVRGGGVPTIPRVGTRIPSTNPRFRSPSVGTGVTSPASGALDLVVDLLAIHRLTRLATADVITARPRNWVVGWAYRARGGSVPEGGDVEPWGLADYAQNDPEAPKLATLVTCRWCAGLWLAVGVGIARRWAPVPWGYVARVLASSSAAGLLAAPED